MEYTLSYATTALGKRALWLGLEIDSLREDLPSYAGAAVAEVSALRVLE